MEKPELSMKLLIDTESKKVLFAEVDKDCVDFLFGILSLPLATVTKLLKNQGMAGCLENLYTSIENLSQEYVLQGQTKRALLNPTLPDTSSPLLQLEYTTPPAKMFYMCGSSYTTPPSTTYFGGVSSYTTSGGCTSYVTDDPRAVCLSCLKAMTLKKIYIAPPSTEHALNGAGFVKPAVTYKVMDDLAVEPLSLISSIASLKMMNVQKLSALQERVVTLSLKEALMLLNASLSSDQVLTEVFLKGSGST